MRETINRAMVATFALVLAIIFFIIDLSIPLGVASGVLYVIAVLVCLWSPRRSDIIFMAIICSALTFLGYYGSPDGGVLWKVVSNRLVAIIAIWSVGIVSYSMRRSSDGEIRLALSKLNRQKLALDKHAIVAITDATGKITYANERFCKISQYSAEELIGQNHSIVNSGYHPRTFWTEVWKTIASGNVWQGEVCNQAKDGSRYWLDTTIVPFMDEAGHLTQHIAIRTDITKRKNLEAALTNNMSLAEAANHAKSDFLADMSHEIRTPMTAILGFTENMLEANQSESEKLQCIEVIRRNGDHLLDVINNILDLSKVEAGKMTMEKISFSPCDLCAEVAELVRQRADTKGIALNIEYVGAIPETIVSDPTRVRQILINLISNAIKFTQAGSVRLVTRCLPDSHEPSLQFDVIDTGHGMTQDQVSNLFQPFMQADKTTTRKYGGTGLGLTISKRFAVLLGGDISVLTTEVDKGTTFRSTMAIGSLDGITMLEDPKTIKKLDFLANDAMPILPTDLQGLHILLAEDGQDNQRLISFVLKKAGGSVTVVEDGQLAFNAAIASLNEGKPFDCILMDMQMPIMDGYEATRQIRLHGYDNPIIALTANAMQGDRAKCVEAGCNEYATKPINRKKLIETIQQHLTYAESTPLAMT